MTTTSSSFTTQQIPMLVLAMFLAAAAICWQPSSAAANFPQGQQRPFVKSSRMALPASAAMAADEQQQQYPVNSRFYRPAKFMPVPPAIQQQQQQQQYGFGGGSRGGAAAAFNDWANDPAEQFLSLKRASLLARLASQSARGFGRRRK